MNESLDECLNNSKIRLSNTNGHPFVAFILYAEDVARGRGGRPTLYSLSRTQGIMADNESVSNWSVQQVQRIRTKIWDAVLTAFFKLNMQKDTKCFGVGKQELVDMFATIMTQIGAHIPAMEHLVYAKGNGNVIAATYAYSRFCKKQNCIPGTHQSLHPNLVPQSPTRPSSVSSFVEIVATSLRQEPPESSIPFTICQIPVLSRRGGTPARFEDEEKCPKLDTSVAEDEPILSESFVATESSERVAPKQILERLALIEDMIRSGHQPPVEMCDLSLENVKTDIFRLQMSCAAFSCIVCRDFRSMENEEYEQMLCCSKCQFEAHMNCVLKLEEPKPKRWVCSGCLEPSCWKCGEEVVRTKKNPHICWLCHHKFCSKHISNVRTGPLLDIWKDPEVRQGPNAKRTEPTQLTAELCSRCLDNVMATKNMNVAAFIKLN